MVDITNQEKIQVIGQHIHVQEMKLEELESMLNQEDPSNEQIIDKINNAIAICRSRITALKAVLDQLA